MKVKLNGQDKELSNIKSLNDIIQAFCKNSRSVIAEVNGEIIKSPRWDTTAVKDGDSIELVNFVGGG